MSVLVDLQAEEPSPRIQGGKIKRIEELIEAGRLQEAREELGRQVTAGGENYKTLYLKAKILTTEKRFPDSLKMLERSLALERGDPEVYKLVASNAVALNRMDLAESSLESAAQLAPDDYVVRFRLGIIYFLSDRFALCESELEQVVKLKPTFTMAYDVLGLALEELGQEEGAVQSYRKAIELTKQQNLKDEKAYLLLGKLLSRTGRYRESLPYLQEAVELNPKSAEAFYLLGKVLHHLGDTTEAQVALERSARNDLRYPDPHYLLSRIHLKCGRQEEASREMQLYREIKKLQTRKDDGRRAVRELGIGEGRKQQVPVE